MEDILTSQTLWEGYDPLSEELDVTILNTCESDGIVTKRLYFTGREVTDGKTRVFGVVCQKASRATRPAVLIINDFNKQIDEKVLVDLAERGFVAMAIDYVGEREEGLFTLYPQQLKYCNASAHQDPFNIVTTAREIKLYEYALNSRRAITYLQTCEKVKGVSVFAVSKGVDVGTMVLGTDDRVTNGILAFGRIWRNYPEMPAADAHDLDKQIEHDFKSQSWMLGLAPQTYMLQIKVPLYIIISANSYYTNVRNANKSFGRVNCVSKLLILPKSPDYLPSRYTGGVVKWLKGHYESDSAEIVPCHEGGDYCLRVITQLPLSKITLWYTINAVGRGKHWIKANLKPSEDNSGYYAEISLYEQNCKILAFAQIDGDLPTSTRLFEDSVTVVNLKKANNIIFSAASGHELPPVCTTGEWWNVDLEPRFAKGPMGIVGAIGKAHASFAINDTSLRYNSAFTLGFDVYSQVRQRVKVTAICKFGEQNECYELSAELFGGKWERVMFEKEKFQRGLDGKHLTEKDKVDAFIISADNEFIINNILLV